ncbi:MAG: hypothetical protein AB7J13_04620, partial [Pyrinomonadaceae bacterium]
SSCRFLLFVGQRSKVVDLAPRRRFENSVNKLIGDDEAIMSICAAGTFDTAAVEGQGVASTAISGNTKAEKNIRPMKAIPASLSVAL